MNIDPALLETARRMVEKGVRDLNANRKANKGKPWWEKISSDDIDQSSPYKDVLARIFGDYWKGLSALSYGDGSIFQGSDRDTLDTIDNLMVFRAAESGFALGGEYMTWPALNHAWCEKILALQK